MTTLQSPKYVSTRLFSDYCKVAYFSEIHPCITFTALGILIEEHTRRPKNTSDYHLLNICQPLQLFLTEYGRLFLSWSLHP